MILCLSFMYALIGFFIILIMQAFVYSDLQYVCFYFNPVVGTDLKKVRLCGLPRAWGAIYTMDLCFFTPYTTTCLMFLLLVTTVYSDLFSKSSSFFLSMIIITCSILSCHAPHRHHTTQCLLHFTPSGCFPDPPSLNRDR